MIATEHIHANASTPNFPLRPFVAHVGSPSQLRIVGLPLAIGSWHITAVQVTANYPDNTSQSVNCVKTGNAWSATIPASAAPGMSKNGYLVTADGVDENNNPVSGYVLGMGDVIILNRDSTITVGETTYYLHLVDETPDNPHKGDVDITTGKVYDGTQWIALATLDWDDVKPSGGVPKTDLASSVQTSLGKADTALQPADLDDTVTRTSANGVKSSGIWAALWGALTALPAGFSSLYDWCVAQLAGKQSKITASGILKGDGAGGVSAATAGTDFQAPLSQTQLDNIAAVPNKADASDLPYAIYKPTDFGDPGGEPCADRAINRGVCQHSSALVYVPAPIAGKSRDFLIRLDASSRSSDVPVTVEGATLVGPDGTAIATLTVKSHSVTTWRLTEVENGATSPFADPVFMVTGANQAPLADPVFTGTPTAPTPTSGDNSTKVATTAFVQGEIAGKLSMSGGTMTGALRFGYDTAGFAAIIFTEVSDGTSIGSYGVKRADQSVGASWPFRDGTLALIQDIADNFSSSVSYDKDSLCSYNSTIYRCINPNGHTGAWVDADFTPATVEDVLAALRTGKANRASSATAGNLAALDANGNPTDAGYHFEVRNGIPCIVQYT